MATAGQRARLSIVALTIFMDLLGFGIIIPLMPHLAETYGATPFLYGLLAASYSLMQFLFVPIWGRLSDRWGRRPVLLISIAGSALSFLLLGSARSLTQLFVARILSGVATSNLSVAQAYVADVTRPEERARGMGMVGAAFGLGFVVGPFIGGELSRVAVPLPFGLVIHRGAAPFFLAALLSTLNWLLAFRLLPESLPAGGAGGRARVRILDWTRLRRELSRPAVSGLFLVSFLVLIAFSSMEQTLILFGERRVQMDAMGAGRLLGLVGVLMVIVQGGLVGRLARSLGEERLAVGGIFLIIPGLLMIAAARSWGLLIAAMVPLAVGSGFLHPSLHALLSKRTPPDEQGGILGLNQSLSSLARVIGPSAGGWLFQSRGEGTPYLAGAVLVAVALLVSFRALRAEPSLAAPTAEIAD